MILPIFSNFFINRLAEDGKEYEERAIMQNTKESKKNGQMSTRTPLLWRVSETHNGKNILLAMFTELSQFPPRIHGKSGLLFLLATFSYIFQEWH